jgi:hypothetical protein
LENWKEKSAFEQHLGACPLEILLQLSKLQLATLKLLDVSLHMMDNRGIDVNSLVNSWLKISIQFRLQTNMR